MLGSYIAMHPQPLVDTGTETSMTFVNPIAYASMWLLLILLWKPAFYTVMYLYGVVSKNNDVALRYGANLHTWITNLFSLVM